jgi:hypothetical protein
VTPLRRLRLRQEAQLRQRLQRAMLQPQLRRRQPTKERQRLRLRQDKQRRLPLRRRAALQQ